MDDERDDAPLTAWSVKNVSYETRRLINDAAKRRDMLVGEWLEMVVRAHVAREREPLPGEVIPPGLPSDQRDDPPSASLEVVVQLAAALPRLTETQGCSRLAGLTRRVIESHLRGLTAGQTGMPPRLTGPQ